MEMQRTLNCSDKKMLELNQCLGVILGQKNLEPYLAAALTARNKQLEDLFTIQDLNFIIKEKVKKKEVEQEILKPVVFADIPALITCLLESREIDTEQHQLQLGLDSGQNILKVCLIVCEKEKDKEEPLHQRARHCDGIGGREAKLTLVKRLLIVACAPEVAESWANIKTILEKLDIGSLGSCPISVDVKVMLILCGKQAASSKHPCPYCECQAPFICPCLPNTLGSLARHYQKYVEAGSKKSTAMNFNNCVNPALLHGNPDRTILDLLTFPEFHVMIGTTGHIVK